MKILFVSAVLPYPLHSGGQIRIYQLLSRLSRNHEITLVSFIRQEGERALAKHLSFCKRVIMVRRGSAWRAKYLVSALFGVYSFLLATYSNTGMRRVLKDLLGESFDLVHLEPFYVWPSFPRGSVPVVVSEHNIEYQVYSAYARQSAWAALRPFMFVDIFKLRFWEQLVWRQAKVVTAVSREDARIIKNSSGRDARIIPNGVDTTQFRFAPRQKEGKDPVLLFVGDFKWFPNRDATTVLVRDIWPGVQKTYPNAVLRIVGRHMASGLKGMMTRAGAQVRENVADISKEYRDADMLVAPHAIAGGTKFKMLEAFASGLPVVTTPQGVAGLEVRADREYLEAASPSEFLTQITRLLKTPSTGATISRAARAVIEEKYSWDAIAKSLEQVWKEVA